MIIRRRSLFFRIARICAMFFVGLAVSLIIALSQVNLETMRKEIDAALEHATGMNIEIRGKIYWKFSLAPRVAISDVVIPAKEWAKNKHGVQIESVIAHLDLLSLLGKTATISDLTLINPVVYLEKNANGEHSLDSSRSLAAAQESDAPPKFPFDSDWGIDSVIMKNPKFTFIDQRETAEFAADEIFLKYRKDNDSIEYDGHIVIGGQKYSFIASLSQLDADRKVYPVRVAIANKLTPVVANIALEQVSKMPIDFIIKGKVADAETLLKHFIPDFPEIAPMTLNISGGMGHDRITLRNTSISFGKSDLSVSGAVSWRGKKPDITVKLKSKQFILGEVFPKLYGQTKMPWEHPNRPLNIFKNTPLYSEHLNIANADIVVDFANLMVYRSLSVESINSRLKIKDGAISVSADAKFADGDLKAAILAHDDNGAVIARAAGQGRGVVIGKILESVGENDVVSGLPADFEFYLEGQGTNLSELMSSVTGPIQARSVAGGTALPDAAKYLYGQDFLTSLRHSVQDMVGQKNKYDKIAISCAAINLKIRNGMAETERGIALQTNAVNMRAAGGANLGKETLDAALVSTPVRGLKLSITGSIVNSIEFKGSMAEPDIKFDGGAMISRTVATTGIGMLLLAPFTGGLSLVAGAGVGFLAGDLLNNWLADDHPCDTAIKKGAPAKNDDPIFLNKPLSELTEEMF
jgi:hypothetical protein